MESSTWQTVLGLRVRARSDPRPAATSALWTEPSAASHAGHVSCVSTRPGRAPASHSTSRACADESPRAFAACSAASTSSPLSPLKSTAARLTV
eukprot:20394-Rhodomonas_salina.1